MRFLLNMVKVLAGSLAFGFAFGWCKTAMTVDAPGLLIFVLLAVGGTAGAAGLALIYDGISDALSDC